MTDNDKLLHQNEPKTRAQIKEYFKNGMLPSENDFSDLINSMVNVKDDGFSKSDLDGLKLYSVDSKRFITFYNGLNELKSYLVVDHDNKDNDPSLKFQGGQIHTGDENTINQDNENSTEKLDKKSFFFHLDGKLGIGKRSDKNLNLDVDGNIGMKGRIGTFKSGTIDADKKWYTIIDNLNSCQAFEIVARTGKAGTGKFAMIHAIALSTYGKSKNKIRKTSAYYGPFWNKLNLRWAGETNNYRLEMRSNSNYTDGNGKVKIYYSVTSLWDENIVPVDYVKKSNETQLVNVSKGSGGLGKILGGLLKILKK